jgi:hypothetical protein
MKTDEEIDREAAEMAPVVGPTCAEWYAEACRVTDEAGHAALLWACRTRETIRTKSRDLKEIADAAEQLVRACSRLDEGGGERVRSAVEAVEKALWWKESNQ